MYVASKLGPLLWFPIGGPSHTSSVTTYKKDGDIYAGLFNVRARGEVSRILFALADVEYEDKRVTAEEWTAFKSEAPFNQLPVLKVDDATLCQSDAIEFYIAKKFGFAGSNALEEAQILMVGGCVVDTLAPMFKMYGVEDEATKDEIRRKYETEQMPKYLGMLEKLLVSNKDGNGYFVGNKISLADLKDVGILDSFRSFKVTVDMDDYPRLKSLNDRVRSEPRIAAWIAKRPETAF